MYVMNLFESLFRWIHVVAGIIWIGHLYFFNWVNSQFEPTLDAETKKKVIPELRPRALYWFRWGAAFTWVTGVLLLMMVFYHGGALLVWSPGAIADDPRHLRGRVPLRLPHYGDHRRADAVLGGRDRRRSVRLSL